MGATCHILPLCVSSATLSLEKNYSNASTTVAYRHSLFQYTTVVEVLYFTTNSTY